MLLLSLVLSLTNRPSGADEFPVRRKKIAVPAAQGLAFQHVGIAQRIELASRRGAPILRTSL
jgi:hypothetical protein